MGRRGRRDQGCCARGGSRVPIGGGVPLGGDGVRVESSSGIDVFPLMMLDHLPLRGCELAGEPWGAWSDAGLATEGEE